MTTVTKKVNGSKVNGSSKKINSNGHVLTTTGGLQPKERETLIKDVTVLDQKARSFKIVDEQTRTNASLILSSIKSKAKEIQAKRDAIVKPIKAGVKLIEDEFKIVMKPLDECESLIKAEISRDFRVQEEIRRKAEEKARHEIEKKTAKLEDQLNSDNPLERELAQNKVEQIETKAESKIPTVTKSIYSEVGSTSVRKIWKFEVTDFSKVPDEYKEICNPAVNTAIRNGVREIPGVRIYEDLSVSGR